MLNLDDVEEFEEDVSNLLSGEDSTYSIGGFINSPLIDEWIKKTYLPMTKDEILMNDLRDLKIHEITHKSQLYKVPKYDLNDYFGMDSLQWSNNRKGFRRSVMSEDMAYLATLSLENDMGATILALLPHYFAGKKTAYYYTARHLLNTLDGRSPADWIDYTDQKQVLKMALRLMNDKKLNKKAKKLFEKSYSNIDLKEIEFLSRVK
jgi:hypothetical protein